MAEKKVDKMKEAAVQKGANKEPNKPAEPPGRVLDMVPHETDPNMHYVLNMELHGQVVVFARINVKKGTYKMFVGIHPGTSTDPKEVLGKARLNKAVPPHADVLAPLLLPVVDDKYMREE